MMHTNIRLGVDRNAAAQFRSAVSLHGHTLHSRETMDFIYRMALRIPPVRAALRKGEARFRAAYGTELDLSRAWWTPPLAPHQAWSLETSHIRDQFGVDALVSLTDHDDIEAPLMLRVIDECHDVPVSVEWTVPFGEQTCGGGTFVHLGVHGIAADTARGVLSDLAAYTAHPRDAELGGILEGLAANPETLIVFNHPCWDEKGVGPTHHRAVICELLRQYGGNIHALEINGLRPWLENRDAIALAHEFSKPVISGGDRHALEPNTILNLTNATTFSEFVAEVRDDWSDVLITERYTESFFLRIVQSIQDIVRPYNTHGRWSRWDDRVFYRCDDGEVRAAAEMWEDRVPFAARLFAAAIQVLDRRAFQQVFRAAFAGREEVVL